MHYYQEPQSVSQDLWGNDDEDDFLNAYATPEEVVFEKEVLLCKDVDKKAEDRMI